MFKRKDKNLWVEKVSINGEVKTFYGHTQKEVLEKIREYKEDRSADKAYSDVIWEWLEEHCKDLSPCRARGYRSAAKKLTAWFGVRRVGAIRTVDLANALKDATDGLTRDSADRYLSVLVKSMGYAQNCGLIDTNPALGLTIPKGLRRNERRELPTAEDIDSVRQHTEYPMGVFANIALFTGLRRGEILALRKSDIDLDRRLIRITKAVQYRDNGLPDIKPPKTEAGIRIVSIPDELYPLLQNIPHDIVISEDGEYFTEKRFVRAWQAYAKANGITATPHQFRHAFTTAIIDLGLSPQEAQLLLGHANLATTTRIYDHIRDQRRIAAADKTRSLSF